MSALSSAASGAGAGAAAGSAGGPVGALAGAAIGAAAGLGSSFLGAKSAKKQVAETNRANSEEASKQRLWQEQMYTMYESPEAKMRQAHQAGINPYSVVENGVMSGGSIGSGAQATMQSSAGETMQAYNQAGAQWQNILQTAANQSLDLYMKSQQAKNLAVQNENIEAQTESTRIQNAQDQITLNTWNRPLESADLAGFLGYDEHSKWYLDFNRLYGRKPTFGDLYTQAILKAPGRDLNRRNGIGADTAVMPHIAYLNWLNNNYGFSDSRDYTPRNFALNGKRNLGIFDSQENDEGSSHHVDLNDVAWRMLTGDFNSRITENDYNIAVRGYKDRLIRHGINPEAATSGLPETLLRYLISNDKTGGIDHLANTLMDVIGSTANNIANFKPVDFIHSLFEDAKNRMVTGKHKVHEHQRNKSNK